ncbi:MAG: competence protein ComJ [Thermoanaerobaculales bacterium]|nr:competence protein ComJ [Thermoanaerobaculales bacterium]
MSQFELDVSYGQIAIFDPALKNPFNDWSERHNQQGFSWRPGSVSFATIENAGEMRVSVLSSEEFHQDGQAIRVIRVPFSVPAAGQIEVASIADSVLVEVAPGEYSLYFEHMVLAAEEAMIANLVFLRRLEEPKILLADDLLSPGYPLLMEAGPA